MELLIDRAGLSLISLVVLKSRHHPSHRYESTKSQLEGWVKPCTIKHLNLILWEIIVATELITVRRDWVLINNKLNMTQMIISQEMVRKQSHNYNNTIRQIR